MLRMKIEFIECYDDLFTEGFKSLQKTMTIKLYAMEQCQVILNRFLKVPSMLRGMIDYSVNIFHTKEFEHKPIK